LEHNAKPSVKNNAKKLSTFSWHYFITSILKKQVKLSYISNQATAGSFSSSFTLKL